MSLQNDKRDSRALEPELISDPIKKAEAEARNGLRQYDAGIKSIQSALDKGAFKLRPSLILALIARPWLGSVHMPVTTVRLEYRSKGASTSRQERTLYQNWLKSFVIT